jgi:hypothetical protein
MPDNWSAEETDDPRTCRPGNFYKVEKWSRTARIGCCRVASDIRLTP